MVATSEQSETGPRSSAAGPPAPGMGGGDGRRPAMPPHPKGGLRRLLSSVFKIVDLQIKIWLTHAKLTMQRIALYAALFAAAVLLGILGVIFLYIGVFRLLTDVAGLRPVWAYLIFGGFHALLAVGLMMYGSRMLHKKDDSESSEAANEKSKIAAPDSANAKVSI